MQNLKSSNAKRRKLLYYLYHTPLVYFFPSIISRLRLKNILNNSFQEEYIQSRVRYYFKKTSNFRVSNEGKNLSELFWNQFFKNKQNSHFIDFYNLLQFFNKKNKVDFIYSTKDYIDSSIAKKHPPYPTFVKSRPVGFNNQNSILLKLNQVKLFHFIKDPKKFENKKNQAVWRGDIRNNSQREYFVKNFYRTPLFDIGQTSPKQDVAWMKSFMSIKEQLDFKFIFCLEGKCISTNLYWAMSSNSVCVMPKPKYESWFMEGKLEDGVHYIEVKDDFSDAQEKIEFYNNNNDKCLEIIQNAQKFVKQFKNAKQERLIQLLILKQYFQYTGQNG
tara:strand:- start:2238 stop:3230 length:993 start_codon:yes stop_codon:yes gene_type:complete